MKEVGKLVATLSSYHATALPRMARHYPPLRVDDVRAATAYAVELARERIIEIDQRGVA